MLLLMHRGQHSTHVDSLAAGWKVGTSPPPVKEALVAEAETLLYFLSDAKVEARIRP